MRRRRVKPRGPEEDVRSARPYTSEPIYLNIMDLENPFYRADLEFHGVDHSAESYEGRVFVNNPNADMYTAKTRANGYVGSFHVFGHGGCYGDVGHCEIRKDRRQYDLRPPHQLTPLYKRIIVTDDLRRLGEKTDKFIITIVPIVAGGIEIEENQDVVKIDRISIVTYD